MYGRPYKKPLYCWRSTPRMCTYTRAHAQNGNLCKYTRAHAQNGNRHFCHFFKLSPEVRPCRSRCWRPRSRWCWPPRPPRAAGPRASRPRPGPLGRARSCRVSWGRGAVTASESIAFGLDSPPGVSPDSTYPCCRCVWEPCQTLIANTSFVYYII